MMCLARILFYRNVLFLFEILLEELDLITDGISPILTGMSTRASNEVVTYFLSQEAFVYGLVYIEEEIVYATEHCS